MPEAVTADRAFEGATAEIWGVVGWAVEERVKAAVVARAAAVTAVVAAVASVAVARGKGAAVLLEDEALTAGRAVAEAATAAEGMETEGGWASWASWARWAVVEKVKAMKVAREEAELPPALRTTR